ncbi:MAG: 16S rRNA (cytosine(1402)-N(4))-methyltransferase RsmH [Eubacterium sp.]
MEFNHKSVLFDESINALDLTADKVVLDATAGGGGHSKAIAQRAKRLIAVDQDPDAIAVLNERLGGFDNVDIVNDNFDNIKNILKNLNIEKIDGLLMDLGVSSFQLDTAERGFSFHKDAPLDMRMSKSGMSAYDVVNSYGEQQLADILFRYGEEKFSRRIAKNIVSARQDKPIETTFELVDIIKASYPQKAMRDSHPARKTFQAIRIEVNAELDRLSKTLDDAFDCLAPGGRIAVITFHSLEDRIVKEKFASWCKGCTCPKEFPVCVCGNKPKGRLPFKSKAPSQAELEENPRARSSRLRVFEKF